MGWFKYRDEFVDLRGIRKRALKPRETSKPLAKTNSSLVSNAVSSSPPQSFFSNFFGSQPNPASSDSKPNFLEENYDDDSPEERRRKLAQRLSAMTNQLDDLSNQIYKLEQRIEYLERKLEDKE